MNEPISPDDNVMRTPEQNEEEIARFKRHKRWKIFGWVVIGAMALLLVVNQFILVAPTINRIALVALFVAYIAYVILRRR